ncbi:MAG: DUF3298 domain-containing protein [Rhizobiales bacterium]|nr:DUF3298 domain-containing protein [Hyphomicrobiales bacterium]OJY43124.1 MAG: hypothetical protein BGP08_20870 [Rhizobiales bacterium 64-17]
MSDRLVRLAALSLIGLATFLPAGSADAQPKRAVTSSNFAEIKVSLDETIKGLPKLAADCRREGDRWAAKWRKDAAKALREEAYIRENGVHWALEREYEAASVIGRYVSVLRSDYLNTGGAHPNTQIDTVLWDGAQNKRVSIRPLFAEAADGGATMTALAALLRTAINAEKKKRGIPQESIDDPEWLKGIEPRLLALGPVTLTPSTEPGKSAGLTFHYQPYAVGPYVEGIYTIALPWQDFAVHLSDQGRALFGGERPADDVKKYEP